MQRKKEDWITSAYQSQYDYYLTLGSRPHDEIPKSDLFHLKKIVGFASCGTPKTLPSKTNLFTGYSKEQLQYINKIWNKIIKKSDRDPILFSCIILIVHHKGIVCETPVFNIKTTSGVVFIDLHARVYKTWAQFQKENNLPDCEYCYPVNGYYHTDEKGMLKLSIAQSPASTLASKTVDGLDSAGTVVSIGAAGIIGASVFMAVAPAAMAAASVAAVSTSVYSLSRSVYSLVDRKKHGQSVGVKDAESRSAWMSIATSAVSMGAAGALAKAQKVVESGKSLSRMSLVGLRALNATSVIFSGFGFVDTLIICYDKLKKGVLTKKDVFDLSCELLFLFNAVVATKATNELIKNMNVAVNEAPVVQKKLTKTQKRNLRKRNAKRRAKGLITSNTTEVNNISKQSASGLKCSPTLIKLVQLAALEFAPRHSKILYEIQSMGHDIMCWRVGDISEGHLLSNLKRRFCNLWEQYSDDVENVFVKVADYFVVIVDEMRSFICGLYKNATKEQQTDFCTRIISMEDYITTTIEDVERDVLQLEGEIENDSTEGASENDEDDFEVIDDNSLNNDDDAESKDVFKVCVKLIKNSSVSCSNLIEFGHILDSVQLVVKEKLTSKISAYSKVTRKAKAISGKTFDLEKFNNRLGIEGDVVQYMFERIINNISSGVYRIKTEFDAINNKYATGVPVWEALSQGIFHCFGATKKGHLSETELLSLVRSFLIMRLTKEGCQSLIGDLTTEHFLVHSKILEKQNILMVDVKINQKENAQIVVYRELTADNTASMMVFVFI